MSGLEPRDQSGELIDPLPGHYTPEWSYRREKQHHPTEINKWIERSGLRRGGR